MPDNVGLHFSAGLGAGLAATILGSPWDVIGTRLMARTPVPGANDILHERCCFEAACAPDMCMVSLLVSLPTTLKWEVQAQATR